MVFSSLVFLSVFLPTVLLCYWLLPSIAGKNILLLAASLFFYAYGEPVYVFLMLASSLFHYLCALWICADSKRNKMILAAVIAVNLGLLCVFKYAAFLTDLVNRMTGLGLPVPQVALPAGISFFTFQAMSYVIDVYRSQVRPQRNFAYVLLYICLFPQLIAGPIVKYHDVEQELFSRRFDAEETARGIRRFIAGLGKKVLIANYMGEIADTLFAAPMEQVNMAGAWLGAASYMLQIYFDFSGYSDMAIGLGWMFGFHFKENFDHPYGSLTIKEFWRRWHISLSSWFKEYVYIPLGGNRNGKVQTGLNKMIVFFLTGLWHGANWTFVVWGLFHGAFSFFEEFVPSLKKLPRGLLHVYTMLVVTVGFVIFRSDTLGYALLYIGKMFTGFEFSAASMSFVCQEMTPFFIAMLAAAVIGCAPICFLTGKIYALSEKEGSGADPEGKKPFVRLKAPLESDSFVQTVLYLAAFVLLLWCILRLSGGSYNPFIYFRF